MCLFSVSFFGYKFVLSSFKHTNEKIDFLIKKLENLNLAKKNENDDNEDLLKSVLIGMSGFIFGQSLFIKKLLKK